jgi:putative zinc finger/helix-turn-helix YgiT family protein
MNPSSSATIQRVDGPLLECPECGEPAVTTKMTPHTFEYGRGENAVPITADLPLRVCGHCGFEYYDKEGQEARHAAVCRHLGVLTPAEIRQLRERHGLSRTEFADLTGLGEATIARWERGALIQNIGNDRFLRLLGSGENVGLLRTLKSPGMKDDLSAKSEPLGNLPS